MQGIIALDTREIQLQLHRPTRKSIRVFIENLVGICYRKFYFQSLWFGFEEHTIAKMTEERVSEKWSDWFCRVADRDANMPRFSLIGSKGYLYEFDGYFGGHEELDRDHYDSREEWYKAEFLRKLQPWE